jgi:hypothetical protein
MVVFSTVIFIGRANLNFTEEEDAEEAAVDQSQKEKVD